MVAWHELYGASDPQTVTIGPKETKTVTFTFKAAAADADWRLELGVLTTLACNLAWNADILQNQDSSKWRLEKAAVRTAVPRELKSVDIVKNRSMPLITTEPATITHIICTLLLAAARFFC